MTLTLVNIPGADPGNPDLKKGPATENQDCKEGSSFGVKSPGDPAATILPRMSTGYALIGANAEWQSPVRVPSS